ncbi:MAG: hypothetical protein U9N76_01620 [Candidatus Marinimicrobia bacterium]|nr:hypothetical protein [Candidatus Neomarinimicrobiota bacterium]
MNKKILILVVVLIFSVNMFGSIFDTYGIGRIGIDYSVASAGCGYTHTAYDGNLSVNFQNPASLSNTKYAGFALGIKSHFNNISPFGYTESPTEFSYGTIILPMTKKGGISFGLKPIASASSTYNINNSSAGYSEEIKNTGKIYSANINVGYKILPFLDIGVGYEFLSGGYNIVKFLDFTDESMISSSLFSDYGIDGGGISAGLVLSMRDKINFGVSYTHVLNVNQRVINTYNAVGNSYITQDTVNYNNNILPNKLNIGITYNVNEKLHLNFEYLNYNFSDVKLVNSIFESGGINNYSQFGIGLERSGTNSEFDSFFKKVTYRFGGFYKNNYYHNSLDESVISKGITVGFGIPYNKFKSSVDLSFVLEKNSGTIYESQIIDAVNIDETVYRVGISFLTTEKWFNTKGKYR